MPFKYTHSISHLAISALLHGLYPSQSETSDKQKHQEPDIIIARTFKPQQERRTDSTSSLSTNHHKECLAFFSYRGFKLLTICLVKNRGNITNVSSSDFDLLVVSLAYLRHFRTWCAPDSQSLQASPLSPHSPGRSRCIQCLSLRSCCWQR